MALVVESWWHHKPVAILDCSQLSAPGTKSSRQPGVTMTASSLRLLVIGAHPDDCEVKAGGLTAIYRDLGHQVRFLSMTNGATGHHEVGGIELAL
ncbi:MAG: hypothetical protein HOC05_15930, partial [Gemmatimonadetes bacterium]|nr:hypothetical protein [Gemmatimonadota bacterium]